MISVLLPLYNAEKTIKACIESILNQSLRDFELIIINNNSTDTGTEITQEFSIQDKRIKILHERNQGISYALNKGIKNAQYQYIARIDADDEMLPNRLQMQFDFLESNPQIDLISGLAKVDPNHCLKGFQNYIQQLNLWLSEDELYVHRFVESPFPHPSVMFRKKLMEKFGLYSTNTSIPEDYELWLRFYENNVRMAKLNQEVIVWRDLPNRLTRNHQAYHSESFDQIRIFYLKKHLEKIKLNKPIIAIGDGKLARRKIKKMINSGIPIAAMLGFKSNSNSFIPTYSYDQISSAENFFFISIVSNRGKFSEIRSFLESKNYTIEKDFILAS